MLLAAPPPHRRRRPQFVRVLLATAVVAVVVLGSGFVWLQGSLAQSSEAPEAAPVLSAQASVPFQVLIPAFLPRRFDREKTQVETSQPAPSGEQMIRITYPTYQGNSLALREWVPSDAARVPMATAGVPGRPVVIQCRCQCLSRTQCVMDGIEIGIDRLRVGVDFSIPNLVTTEEMQLIIDTLGAANSRVYSSVGDVPVTHSLPPAVDVPVNADGIQAFTIVVTPEGYEPSHVSLKAGVPARLTFRQLGEVGCGNELIFRWGADLVAELTLASQGDSRTLDFTPNEVGDFQFSCPHLIYRGAITVTE